MREPARQHGDSIPPHSAVLRFVEVYSKEFGWPPSRREVAYEFNVSLSTAQELLVECQRAGLIDIGHGARQLRLTDRGSKLLKMKQIVDPTHQL